jgi:transcription termination/antitermination protein NusG
MTVDTGLLTRDQRVMADLGNNCPFLRAGDWFVLHTRGRQEKALAADLDFKRIPYFLPVRREVRFYGKRKCFVDTPLFSSYLFIKGSLEDAYAADRTKRVANILRCPDQKKITWELANINLALLANASLSLYPRFVRGIRVEVRSGPFRGIQGIIEDRAKGDRLILQVEILGRAVSFEVDGSLLDVIEAGEI